MDWPFDDATRRNIVGRCAAFARLPESAPAPALKRAAVAIALVDYAFPFYLAHVSTIASFGTTLVFIAIVLLWFYALAIIILAGATVNAMRLPRAPEEELA